MILKEKLWSVAAVGCQDTRSVRRLVNWLVWVRSQFSVWSFIYMHMGNSHISAGSWFLQCQRGSCNWVKGWGKSIQLCFFLKPDVSTVSEQSARQQRQRKYGCDSGAGGEKDAHVQKRFPPSRGWRNLLEVWICRFPSFVKLVSLVHVCVHAASVLET